MLLFLFKIQDSVSFLTKTLCKLLKVTIAVKLLLASDNSIMESFFFFFLDILLFIVHVYLSFFEPPKGVH